MTERRTRRAGRPKDLAKAGAILDAGWALFLERGVGASSIEAIAQHAGVSKMTVYAHFADKHALFEAAVTREMRSIEAAQAVEPRPDATTSLREKLRTFGTGLLSFLATEPALDFYNVLSGELRRHPDLARTFYNQGPGRTLANLAALLAGASDELPLDDPVEAAEALFGLWQGASNYRLALGVERALFVASIPERVDRGVALFLRAYARHG